MNGLKFIQKMHTVVKRSIFLSFVLAVFVLCLIYGVFGSGVTAEKYKSFTEKEEWYKNKELKLVHVVNKFDFPSLKISDHQLCPNVWSSSC